MTRQRFFGGRSFVAGPIEQVGEPTAPRLTQSYECLCWCEKQTVKVSSEMIRRGQTESCGALGCISIGPEPLRYKGYA